MFFKDSFQVRTEGETDIIDITHEVERRVATSGIRDGILCLSIPGSTASITTIEAERGVMEDLKRAIERMAPRDITYEHDRAWGDGNGHAHVRAALVGPALSLPVSEGRPVLGTWQQIVLLDFDNRPRIRTVILHVLGE